MAKRITKTTIKDQTIKFLSIMKINFKKIY